jgi:hypothetical protein
MAPHTEWMNGTNWSATALWNQTNASEQPVCTSSTQFLHESESVIIRSTGPKPLNFGSQHSLKILAPATRVDVHLEHLQVASITAYVGSGRIELEDLTISNHSRLFTGQGDVLITTAMPDVTLAYDTNTTQQCVAAGRVEESGGNAREVGLFASTDNDNEDSLVADTGSRQISVDLDDGALYATLFTAVALNASLVDSLNRSAPELQTTSLSPSAGSHFTAFLEVQKSLRDWIFENPTLDHVAYIEMTGPGQQQAGRWMFATNKVYRFISPWVLSALSGGLLTPRRKYIPARVFPTECPYRSGWQAKDDNVLSAVTMAISDRLVLDRRESLVLLQRATSPVGDEVEDTLSFAEGNRNVVTMFDLPQLWMAILCSVVLACFVAISFAFGAYWFAAWGARSYHQRHRSKVVYRSLKSQLRDSTKDKQFMLERKTTASLKTAKEDDDDHLPGPLELLCFAIEEQAQMVRTKLAKVLFILSKEPKQGGVEKSSLQAANTMNDEIDSHKEFTRMDAVEMKRDKYSLINVSFFSHAPAEVFTLCALQPND